MTLSTAALRYAEHGWPVFPVQRRGKAPIHPGGFHNATTDLETVRGCWAKHPSANIGFCPGRAGLIVFDIDGPEGERKGERLGLFAEPTLLVETARGLHVYFEHPGGHIGNRDLGAGLDVRADAGYVLVPPSVHPTGAIYRARGTVDGIISVPPAALEALKPPEPPPVTRDGPPINAGTPRRRAYVQAAIESECLDLSRTPEGGRNNGLNRAAFSLARFVATGEAKPGPIMDALRVAARHTGLPDWEIEKTIRSALEDRGVEV